MNSHGGKPGAENPQLIARRKAAKMLIAVVIMFGICYLPVHLLNILRLGNLFAFIRDRTKKSRVFVPGKYIQSQKKSTVKSFMNRHSIKGQTLKCTSSLIL